MSRRVKFLRGTVLGTGLTAGVGEVVELEDDALANQFVKQEKAVFVDGTELPEDPGIIQTPEPPKGKAARTR